MQLATNQGVVLPPRSSAAKNVLAQVRMFRTCWLKRAAVTLLSLCTVVSQVLGPPSYLFIYRCRAVSGLGMSCFFLPDTLNPSHVYAGLLLDLRWIIARVPFLAVILVKSVLVFCMKGSILCSSIK